MKAVRLCVLAFLLAILVACNKSGDDGGSVNVNTGGIFNPVSFSYNDVEIKPVHDLGEYLLGTPKKVFTFRVRNNSLFNITRMNVTIEGFTSYGFKFNKDPNGLSAYPGYTGTCADSLPPAGTCTVALQFETSIKGQYEQDIVFSYVNLVESAQRNLKLLVLAGNPASLIFEGDETDFTFGELIGLSQLPVVEREDGLTYEQTLTVINAGDLKAREITPNQVQDCESDASGECPFGLNTAYSYSSNCPDELAAEETCQVTIRYFPKNKDLDPENPNPEWKQVRFNSTFRFDYYSSLEGPNNRAALNAYFTSISTNIEANFKTSIDSLPFETQLTVGNRMQKSVRINNKGFREGQLRYLVIEKLGTEIGYCIRSSGLNMECYTDTSFTTPLSLATFPFFFRDKNECFGTSALNDGAIVNVDSGCQLDLFFQPSVTYKVAGSNSFSLHAEFDSNWKGNETLRRNFFLVSSGNHLAAARLVPEKITFAGNPLPSTSLHPLNETMSFDMGRVGMMSSNSFARKNLEITFLNVGDVMADGISAIDGWGLTIPKKEDPAALAMDCTGKTSGVCLRPSGGDNKPMFAGAKISTAYCNQIPPGSRCTISISYAPISKGTVENTRTYMFDNINLVDPLLSYKSFFMNYTDGSLYSDENRWGAADVGPTSSQAQLKATLVAKGVLGEIDLNNLGVTGGPHPYSKTTRSYVILNNIGTDKIRYLGYTGDTLFTQKNGIKIVESDLAALTVKHAAKLYGPLKDCKDIVDFDYDETRDCSLVTPKLYSVGNPAGLGYLDPDESCALTFERSMTPHQYTNITGDKADNHELGRLNDSSLQGTEKSWEFLNRMVYLNSRFDYYDNDVSNPSAVGPLGACVGSRETSSSGTRQIEFLKPGRIAPHTPYPNASAILYRRSLTLPELRAEDNSLIRNELVIPEQWFFSPNNVSALTTDLDPSIVTASKSKAYFPASVNISPLNLNDYDYIIHLGSFPVGQTVQAGFYLSATAKALQSTWKGSSSNLIMRPPESVQTNQFSYFIDIPLNTQFPGVDIMFPTGGHDVRINFTADKEGLFASEFTYDYLNGDYDGTPDNMIQVTHKVLIIGEGVDDAPDLEVQVANYKVTTDGFSAPTLTPADPDGFVEADYTPYNASAGDASINEWIMLEAVKIPAPAPSDFFVRKHVKIKNTSTTQTMSLLNLLAKNSPGATASTSINFGNNIKFCFDNSSPLCKGTCGGRTFLLPEESCYFEVFYQPNDVQIPRDITIAANFRIKDNQHFSRNIRFSFLPKDPAVLIAQGLSKEVIRVNFGNMSSYPLDYGSTTEFTADPQIIAFDKGSIGLRRIQVLNTSETRASFLKAYHEYIGTSDISVVPTNYNYNADGVNYTLIYQRNYSPTKPRIQVYATKPCLVGGATAEDDALEFFEKGFNNETDDPCYLAVVLRANSHYMNIDLNTSSASMMEPNHVRLPYYDNNRSSFSYFNIHFRGKLKPNGSKGIPDNSGAYMNVVAASNGTVTFKWKEMTPNNPELGAIVGYRIYYSTSSSALNDVYLATASKIDDFNVPNSTGIYQLTQTALASKKFYYYRVVPIREYNDYTPADTFPGITPFYQLTGKRYLSASGIPQLTVVVPPPDMYYDHSRSMLISRNVKSTDLLDFPAAKTACSSIPKLRLNRSGGNADFQFRLITENAWNSIKENISESAYDPFTLSVWLDGTTQNIHSTLLPDPEYNPLEEAKYLNGSKIFYQKVNNCQPNCSGEKAVGTVYHNPEYAGYTSYISRGFVFASARCYVNLLAP